MVLVRQRPGSAKGVVFMTLEDETGIANIVVWPKVMEQYRKEVMGARLILVEGYIQSSPEHVTHLVAQRMFDRSHDLIGLANDAPVASTRSRPAPRWSSRSTTTAANTRIIPRRKFVTPATSASCRRHGIFIELLSSAAALSSRGCGGKDRVDIVRCKKFRRRYRAGVQARKSVHGCLVAVNRPKELLQLGRRRLQRCELAGEVVHRPDLRVAGALVFAHRILEWPRARE